MRLFHRCAGAVDAHAFHERKSERANAPPYVKQLDSKLKSPGKRRPGNLEERRGRKEMKPIAEQHRKRALADGGGADKGTSERRRSHSRLRLRRWWWLGLASTRPNTFSLRLGGVAAVDRGGSLTTSRTMISWRRK
jgi:hypothetical protein